MVAPLAGAWVETFLCSSTRKGESVAPLAGAWVETPIATSWPRSSRVAPLAGAWVETITFQKISRIASSRAPRGRVG